MKEFHYYSRLAKKKIKKIMLLTAVLIADFSIQFLSTKIKECKKIQCTLEHVVVQWLLRHFIPDRYITIKC